MPDWRPIAISADLAHRVHAYNAELRAAPNLLRHAEADQTLLHLISPVIDQIVDREGLPHIAHLICGWGNSKARGRKLLDHVSDFVTYRDGKAYIPQASPIGDFHPWQTFAYAVMSEGNLLYAKCGETLLAELAANSTDLNTSNNTDLGHFLYAYSNLKPCQKPKHVLFDCRSVDISQVVDLAVEALKSVVSSI
jgi:hypothetical protein